MKKKKIAIPGYIRQGILPGKSHFPEKIRLFAGDVETIPYPLLGMGDEEIQILENSEKNFFKLVDFFSRVGCWNFLFFHNLRFDLGEIFSKFHPEFSQNEFSLFFSPEFRRISERNFFRRGKRGIRVRIRWGRQVSATVFFPRKTVYILDSFSFFPASLRKLCQIFRMGKKGTWKEDFSLSALRAYLRRDVRLEYALGRKILEMHRGYNVPPRRSVAGLAAAIFKKKFLQEKIPFPPEKCRIAAEKAYHGGKNMYYLSAPEKIRDIWWYDINSAYPWAMSKIPNFSGAKYTLMDTWRNGDRGVVCVSGRLEKEKYALLYTHAGKKIQEGIVDENVAEKKGWFELRDLWISSYEFEILRKYGFLRPTTAWGWKVVGGRGKNPLRNFSRYFWRKKEKEKTPEKKMVYKTILNSLYGKFIQNFSPQNSGFFLELPNGDVVWKEGKYIAGGLYNPMIAAMTTGMVRAKIFEYEMQGKAIMTSTDAVFCRKKLGTTPGLGGLKLKDFGDCIFFRSRCYIFFGSHISWGRHGFFGTPEQLLMAYFSRRSAKEYRYTYSRMGGIRESLRTQKISPNRMHTFRGKFSLEEK